MSALKHQILEHLTKHGELSLHPADHRFKGDADEIDQAAQELDQAGHAVYTRTMDRLFLAANDKSEKAFKGVVYLEKALADQPVAKPAAAKAKKAATTKPSKEK